MHMYLSQISNHATIVCMITLGYAVPIATNSMGYLR